MQFYIGHDSTQPLAAHVCAKSMMKFGVPITDIHFLKQDELRARSQYFREPDIRESTEFSFTRFLVPYLSGYEGTSVFMDSDFLWRLTPYKLGLFIEEDDAVSVVKHELQAADLHGDMKMNGKVQLWYPRKNWSSLMVFNNAHPDCIGLTCSAVSTMPAQYLHQFEWTEEIGVLPKGFNTLVGYEGYPSDPAAVHFTDGGPWLSDPRYRNNQFADEWMREFERV